eukprot:TRINITY_DN4657_c0_g1_i5.p1 TRINITY_DN4657_c0_g1~~TRINITY_DN4657_c0_g1_i5.p1  ORF type:complete len:658 (-),score=76.91 TRINITY_DN4657_c0_g1_i5:299-2272(-)
MILYDAGDYHLGFIWSLQGSTLPKAATFGLPSAGMALIWRWLLNTYPKQMTPYVNMNVSVSWSIFTVVLGMLLAFRTNKAYARFWEGTTLVQQMRAEWFEACSNLMAFSKMAILKDPTNPLVKQKSLSFGFTLVRLVSLMHGAALRQVTGGDGEEFDVLDVGGLDDESLDYMNGDCAIHDVNRVEVLLHWVQVLITDSIHEGILVTPPPILTRSYQTLSRGMVNLHNVRKLADVPFPFPLSQMLIVLLLIQSVVTPIFVSQLIEGYFGVMVLAFLPTFGMWSITFVSGELEQPFGQDPNDLPLCELQYEMNNSLLMLLDDRAARPPTLKQDAIMDVDVLRAHLGDHGSTTEILGNSEPVGIMTRKTVGSIVAKRKSQRPEGAERGSMKLAPEVGLMMADPKIPSSNESHSKGDKELPADVAGHISVEVDCKVQEDPVTACKEQQPVLSDAAPVGMRLEETTECEEGSTEEDQNILIDTESGCAADADSSCDSDTLAMFPPALADKTVGLPNGHPPVLISARSQSIGTPLQATCPSSDDIAAGQTDSDFQSARENMNDSSRTDVFLMTASVPTSVPACVPNIGKGGAENGSNRLITTADCVRPPDPFFGPDPVPPPPLSSARSTDAQASHRELPKAPKSTLGRASNTNKSRDKPTVKR